MTYRIDIYIGADNGSKKICERYLKKVKEWADVVFPEGYTLLRGEGCYRGIYEDSVLINVLSDHNVTLKNQLEGLKRELNQEAILVVKSTVDSEVI